MCLLPYADRPHYSRNTSRIPQSSPSLSRGTGRIPSSSHCRCRRYGTTLWWKDRATPALYSAYSPPTEASPTLLDAQDNPRRKIHFFAHPEKMIYILYILFSVLKINAELS